MAFIFMGTVPLGGPVPLKRELALFPAAVGEWTGERAMSDTVPLPAGTDAYLFRKYVSSSGISSSLYLYVGYWGKFRHGADVFSGDYVDPGYLWDPVKERDVLIDAGGRTFKAREVVYAKGDYRIAVLYWYRTAHGVTTRRFRGRLVYGLDAMLNRRTNAALVRISTDAFRAGTRSRTPALEEFASGVFSGLDGVLPFDG